MTPKYKTFLSFWLLFSGCFSFLSWKISHRSIEPSESTITWALNTPSAAKAGFPIEAFEIPYGPLGGDFIPQHMYKGLILNTVFWMTMGLLATITITKFAPHWSEKRRKYAAAIGITAILLNNLMFTIWFD